MRWCKCNVGVFVCRLFGGGRTSLSVDDDITCRSPSARCAGCDQPFSGGDLVMRVHLSVFHSSCFTCCVCRRRLSRGQQFALVDAGRIYCRADYERPHAGSVLDDTESAAGAGREASLSVFDGDCECEELQCDDGVRPAAKNDDDALSPSSCGVTLCRGSRRTRKVTPSSYQNTSKTDANCMLTLYCFYVLSLRVFIIYLFTQQMQYNTLMLNRMIKRKVKTTCNLKYNMANELRPYSVFDSCNWVTNWINIIFAC